MWHSEVQACYGLRGSSLGNGEKTEELQAVGHSEAQSAARFLKRGSAVQRSGIPEHDWACQLPPQQMWLTSCLAGDLGCGGAPAPRIPAYAPLPTAGRLAICSDRSRGITCQRLKVGTYIQARVYPLV